jgi:multiple sugar transport system permease protein
MTAMTRRNTSHLLRDAAAITVVALFMFPIFWWALVSIQPESAITNKDRIVFLDFTPTFASYMGTIFGEGTESFDSRGTLLDTFIVASGATLLTLAVALLAGFALSRLLSQRRRGFLYWVVFHRVLPPIATIIPLVGVYHATGLLDTHFGLMLAHAAMNLPFAILLLKSFFDDVPREVGEAASIDGATTFQAFYKIHVPMIRSGIAAAAVLCFIFSWTEFFLAVFLTTSIHMLPVHIQTIVGYTWGYSAALGTCAMIPTFAFIVFVQKHLVRGFTLGLQKA